MRNVRPLHDRLIVKRIEAEEKSPGGIIIPDNAKEKPVEGLVVAVGNGRVLDNGTQRPLDVRAGDRVLFSKYAGTEVKWAGEEHLMMREEDVLGVIEDSPAVLVATKIADLSSVDPEKLSGVLERFGSAPTTSTP